MKISIDDNYIIKLEEVFEPVLFETKDGEKLLIRMRDQGFEIGIKDLSVKNPEGSKVEYYNLYSIKDGCVESVNTGCSKNTTIK